MSDSTKMIWISVILGVYLVWEGNFSGLLALSFALGMLLNKIIDVQSSRQSNRGED